MSVPSNISAWDEPLFQSLMGNAPNLPVYTPDSYATLQKI